MGAELFVCGDIVNYRNKDGLICDNSLEEIVQEADYSIGNFEAPVYSKGTPINKSGPHHYQRENTVKGLRQQGFDLLCLANNHIYDYGTEGLKKTIELASEEGLDTLGAGMNFEEAYTPLIKKINNITVGFINACEAQFGVLDYFSNVNQSGYAWINHREVDNLVIKLKEICDFVIVFSHAGLEHYNIPQKEWRNRYKQLCDLGADLIVGSHPHVPQGYEKHNSSYIFYSLGNFYFDSENYIHKRDDSYSLLINLSKNNSITFKPIFHHKENSKVCLSSPKEKINLDELNELLKQDYRKLHNKMTLEVYNAHLKRNLIYSLLSLPYDGKLLTSFKRIVRKIIGRSKKQDKDVLALHLLRNETYHNVFQHALELSVKEKKRKSDE